MQPAAKSTVITSNFSNSHGSKPQKTPEVYAMAVILLPLVVEQLLGRLARDGTFPCELTIHRSHIRALASHQDLCALIQCEGYTEC